MPSIIVLMGPQGAGKGTQAQRLAETFQMPIVATGDMLRDIAQTDTDLGVQVRQVQAAGQLVSDDILAEVVNNRLSQPDCKNGCILDGFPRTLPQAHLLEDIAESLGHRIIVIEIVIKRELLRRRLAGRRTCSKCNTIYHMEFKPSKKEGFCDLDGAPLFTRSDDNEQAIVKRLALYDEKTKPLLDYYSASSRLYRVDGTNSLDEVSSSVTEIVRRLGGGFVADGR